MIDLLGPLVLVMLRGQQLSYSKCKIAGWIAKLTAQWNHFATEITMEKPSRSASPRLHNCVEDIVQLRYKTMELVEGWLIDSEVPSVEVNRTMRELQDCRNDLKQLATSIIEVLGERNNVGIQPLLSM